MTDTLLYLLDWVYFLNDAVLSKFGNFLLLLPSKWISSYKLVWNVFVCKYFDTRIIETPETGKATMPKSWYSKRCCSSMLSNRIIYCWHYVSARIWRKNSLNSSWRHGNKQSLIESLKFIYIYIYEYASMINPFLLIFRFLKQNRTATVMFSLSFTVWLMWWRTFEDFDGNISYELEFEQNGLYWGNKNAE